MEQTTGHSVSRQLSFKERFLGESVFSLRNVKYFFTWLVLWQDSSVDGSIFQFYTWAGRFPSVRPVEVFLIILFGILFIERSTKKDYRVMRSYFWAPVGLMFLALFVSWCRGVFINQSYGVVYEVHESFELPFAFLLFLNLFTDPKEYRALLLILVLATVPKAVEGAYIKFFSDDPNKSWGVLMMWRDCFMLGLGVITIMLVTHYRGTRYLWLRKVMYFAAPFLFFTLIVSYRRSAFVSIIGSAIALFYFLGKGRRGKHGKLLFGLLLALFVTILASDPIGFFGRISGIIEPKEEGSAYIRLMELPNVLMNIYKNPIWGTAIGTQWHQYFRMPQYANFTTVGVHNTYLYWPLRTGILGLISFWWMLITMWRSTIISWAVSKGEDQWLFAQLAIQMIVIYQVNCLFGLMYGDAVTSVMGLVLTAFQLQFKSLTGLTSASHVHLRKTLETRTLCLKEPKERRRKTVRIETSIADAAVAVS